MKNIQSGTAAIWAGEEDLFADGAIVAPVVNSVAFGYEDMGEWF
jgi:cystathionine gamma-synthase